MKSNQYFKQYQSKLKLEAFLKSLLSGASVGLIAGFVFTFVTWFTAFNGFLVSLAVLLGVTAIATAVFYFRVFYPSVMSNARRLDRLGLEERLITMVEYEKDNSYMANAQRENAKAALSELSKKSIKIAIAKKIWVCFLVCLASFSSMQLINALSEEGLLPGGDDILDQIIPAEKEVYVSVTYDVDGCGYIDGESDQLVLFGQDATPVTAIADEGYAFVEWSDGSTKPYRQDRKLETDIELFAIFEPTEGGGGDGDGDGSGDGNGDGDGQGNGQGNGNGQGEGQGQGEGEGNGEGEGDDGNGTTGGGKYEHSNQIIDGQTYYREVIDDYRDQLAEYLEANRDKLTPEEITIIEQYIKIV